MVCCGEAMRVECLRVDEGVMEVVVVDWCGRKKGVLVKWMCTKGTD